MGDKDQDPANRALSRRIKQHMHAPEHAWFAACPPGLEPLLACEVEALGLSGACPVAGGAEFTGKLEAAYRANLWLRTATRVLLRAAEFRARSPEDLFNHAREVRWEVLLGPSPLRVEVSMHASRMTSNSLVERTLREAIASRFEEQGTQGPCTQEGADRQQGPEQLVLVRLESNRLTVSLDSSGELLHRRGYREATAKAPLRENLAAGILLAVGYDGSAPLLDPMCGAGTFPIEAALIARHLPPGLHRSFMFERWPSYKEATWQHLKAKALEQALDASPHPILGQDLHPGAIAATQANATRAGVLDGLRLAASDFFATPPLEGPAGWIVINPPYGKRVGEPAEIGRLYQRIGAKLRQDFPGWRFAIVVPEPSLYGALKLPESERLLLPHGGLKIGVTIGRVPD